MEPMHIKMFGEPALDALDELAYSAQQPSQYGDAGTWFLSWRMAVRGMRSRAHGARSSFHMLTEWVPNLPLSDPEHELALCLFSMDSALECWTFALNAFGFGIAPSLFFDLRSEKALKGVRPDCVLKAPPKGPDPFLEVFPRVTSLWRSNAEYVRMIMENHDVSKHRHANLSGWTVRMDVPEQILKTFGAATWQELGWFRLPMSQMLLPREPKLARINRSSDLVHWIDFLELKPTFDRVIDETPLAAKIDIEDYLRLHPPEVG